MKPTKLLAPLIAVALLLAMVPQAQADISNAAVLYLRIAPGARAAAMGEAYVAISDDATSTHWNPAGLGAYPLSPGWTLASVPDYLQPLSDIASLKTRGGGTYVAYDIWAITPNGLARYDTKGWYTHEVFDTKTDQTVRKIAASYFSLIDEEVINGVVRKIADYNNKEDYAYLDSLKTAVMESLPESYGSAESMSGLFDSLLAGYDRCLVNWDKAYEIGDQLEEGKKDGELTENELDRIYFAVEKSRTRFIPEQLNIQYSALFDSNLTGIESAGTFLVVGSDNGMYAYDGRRWQIFSTHNGLPSPTVTSMAASDTYVLVATDKGVVKYDGENLLEVGDSESLPEGVITAIAAGPNSTAWCVIDDILYHFDGAAWSDSRNYTVVIDDTPGRIAEKLAIYGSEKERARFTEAIIELNPLDSATGTLDLQPGQDIKVPYTVGLKGEVRTIHAPLGGTVWLGTSYGVVYFAENTWHLPGYKDETASAGQSLADLAALPAGGPYASADEYKAVLMDINGLDGESLQDGQAIKIYRDPTAAPVNGIVSRRGVTYFATDLGQFEYDGITFERGAEHHGLDKERVSNIQSYDNELWIAGDKKVVTKANSRTDISMMYVKWLPELADDLYYAFASFATHKEGWGTFGGNFTYISYGTITRTGDEGQDLGTFESFDLALTGSYGTSLTDKLKGGISAKLLYSKLADQGAGEEQGKGTSTGFAVDLGLLYHVTKRLNLGLAITNLGPDMAYIDAAQSDALPRNLAFGFAYTLLQTDYYHFLTTAEVNKSLVGVDDGFSEELKQLVLNGGMEFLYGNIIAGRAGYIYDQEGDIKTATLGVGIGPVGIFKFDFSYIPSTKDGVLDNTLRISFAVQP